MISVSTVSLEELTDAELALVVKYCAKCPEGQSYSDFVHRVQHGLACVYRFRGSAFGIFILAKGDNGLFVETVAGENVVKYFDEIYREIKVVALACGAKRLYSYISRSSLKRLYDRKTKAEPIATLYREVL